MVEPAFLAPTITPSIAPSAAEVTLPVSAEADGISAATRPADVRPSKAEPSAADARSIALVMAVLPFEIFRRLLGYALRCVVATLNNPLQDGSLPLRAI